MCARTINGWTKLYLCLDDNDYFIYLLFLDCKEKANRKGNFTSHVN